MRLLIWEVFTNLVNFLDPLRKEIQNIQKIWVHWVDLGLGWHHQSY